MKIAGFSRRWAAVAGMSALTLVLLPECLGQARSQVQSVNSAAAPTPQAAAPAAQTALPAVTSAPQRPNMLEEPAQDARVAFSADSLTIRADNSSLSAILNEVAKQSGMEISGLAGDERVFGSFGPAAPSDVLADLLNGTAYDMVMVGSTNHGAPRELILTPAKAGGPLHAAGSTFAARATPEDAASEQDAPEPPPAQPEPPQPPVPPAPGGTRTPQQLFQQLQQMRQQQQQQIPQQQDQSQQQTTTQQ